MSYEEIKAAIESAPTTWIPGLLRAAVEAAIKKSVFVPGGLVRFVTSIVER